MYVKRIRRTGCILGCLLAAVKWEPSHPPLRKARQCCSGKTTQGTEEQRGTPTTPGWNPQALAGSSDREQVSGDGAALVRGRHVDRAMKRRQGVRVLGNGLGEQVEGVGERAGTV